MGKISLFIDGTEIQAEEGMSVLEASLAAGIYIPHLCPIPICLPPVDVRCAWWRSTDRRHLYPPA